MNDSVFFRKFSSSVELLDRPKKFTFPFYYAPHSLAINAANELQQELESTAIEHNFGFSKSEKSSPIGKMFGVLVVHLTTHRFYRMDHKGSYHLVHTALHYAVKVY